MTESVKNTCVFLYRILMNRLVAVAVIVAAMAIVTFACLSGYKIAEALANADSLEAFAVVDDLMNRGGDIHRWHLTPAPYFFPDFLIAAVALRIFSDPFYQVVFCFTAQAFVTLCALAYLSLRCSDGSRLTRVAVLMSLLVFLALIPPVWYRDFFFAGVYTYMLVPAFHYGAFMSMLACLVLWISFERQTRYLPKLLIFVLASAIAFLSVASDKLFLAWFVFPFAVTAVFVDVMTRNFSWRRTLLQWAAFGAGVAGLEVYGRWNTMSWGTTILWNLRDIDWGRASTRLTTTSDMIWTVVTAVPVYAVFGVVYVLIVLHALGRVLLFKKQSLRDKNLSLLTLFSFVSIVTLAAVNLTVAEMDPKDRYSMPLFFFPLIIPVLYVGRGLARWVFPPAMLATAGSMVWLGVMVGGHAIDKGLNFVRVDPYLSCVDAALDGTGARYGFAEYWEARPVHVLSRHPVQMTVFVLPNYWPNLLGNSERYFRANYDFAIVPDTGRDGIVARNGTPMREKQCLDKTVLVYEKDGLTVQDFRKAGERQTLKGCELVIDSGKVGEDCRAVTDASPFERRFVNLQYYNPAAGEYEVEVVYSSPGSRDELVAKWEMSSSKWFDVKTYGNGEIPGTEGETGRFRFQFSVVPEDYSAQFEGRIFVKEKMAMTVISATTTRIDKPLPTQDSVVLTSGVQPLLSALTDQGGKLPDTGFRIDRNLLNRYYCRDSRRQFVYGGQAGGERPGFAGLVRRCFRERFEIMGGFTLETLEDIVARRSVASPEESWTAKLLTEGQARAAKKLGEEAVEAAIAAVEGDRAALTAESADVLYHLLVVLKGAGIPLSDVMAELERRTGQSGLEEKASRAK